MSSEKEVYVRKDFPIVGSATVFLNRPQKANALTNAMTGQLLDELKCLADDPSVLVVVLTGSPSSKHFCTGMDLSAPPPTSTSTSTSSSPFSPANLFRTLLSFPKPLVARVNGPVVGGGTGLLWACDVRVALRSSYVWWSEVKRGLVPALVAGVVARQVGLSRTLHYMMTAEKWTADQLLRDGQLGCVVDDVAGLDEATIKYCTLLTEGGPQAMRWTKRQVREVATLTEKDAMDVSEKLFYQMMQSPEAVYGISAFRTNTKPDWIQYSKSQSKL